MRKKMIGKKSVRMMNMARDGVLAGIMVGYKG